LEEGFTSGRVAVCDYLGEVGLQRMEVIVCERLWAFLVLDREFGAVCFELGEPLCELGDAECAGLFGHAGVLESEAAFTRLAGTAPIPASSGQTIRYRLDRSGDRKLNRALHIIPITRKRTHPATIAYIERRLQEGKTRREANRCLKRYLAHNLYYPPELGPPLAT
jgi:hypothetical protein